MYVTDRNHLKLLFTLLAACFPTMITIREMFYFIAGRNRVRVPRLRLRRRIGVSRLLLLLIRLILSIHVELFFESIFVFQNINGVVGSCELKKE